MKKQITHIKETSKYTGFTALSPQHQRANYSRKIIRINQVIRSILSINHMEKMDLIAINNRSLCNHSKVKRAQRTTRKPHASHNLPNLKEIKLDTRRHSILKKIKKPNPNPSLNPNPNTTDQIQTQLCEAYIEEYLQRLKQQKRFDILADRGKLIQQACRQIIQRLESTKKKPVGMSIGSGRVLGSVCMPLAMSTAPQEVNQEVREIKLPINSRKARSITQIQYSSELSRIRKSSQYSSKARALNEKMFLRKIRQIKLHSLPPE